MRGRLRQPDHALLKHGSTVMDEREGFGRIVVGPIRRGYLVDAVDGEKVQPFFEAPLVQERGLVVEEVFNIRTG